MASPAVAIALKAAGVTVDVDAGSKPAVEIARQAAYAVLTICVVGVGIFAMMSGDPKNTGLINARMFVEKDTPIPRMAFITACMCVAMAVTTVLTMIR